MATKRNSKRKSKDFIYELEECDLSPDDDCEDKPTKIPKITSDIEKTTEITNTSNLQILTNTEEKSSLPTVVTSVKEIITNSNEMNASESEISDKNNVGVCVQETETHKSDMLVDESSCNRYGNTELEDSQRHDDNVNVIQINDSDSDINSSVQIVEDKIPIMIISGDETEVSTTAMREEGEIVDFLEVVDEVGPTSGNEEKAEFIIEMAFASEEIKKHYSSRIVTFLHTFPEFEILSDGLFIQVSKKLPVESCQKIADQKTPRKKHKKKKVKKELFVLDTTPADNTSIAGVQYSSKFSIEEGKEEIQEVMVKALSAQTCFNCGENHALKDCTVAKDYNKINAARQKYMGNKNKVVRYHVEEDQKFAHLKPGVISENLRKALGLRKNEYPAYIYGMRALGYPPGWLEEAKFVHSSLRMFDMDGEQLKGGKKVKTKGLNPDKIVEYPGFNAPLEKGFHDDFRKYNVDPYSKFVGKEYMLKYFESVGPDSSDSEEPNGKNCLNKMNLVQKVQQKEVVSSPSLTDLEKMRKEVINQLNSTNSNTIKISDSNSDSNEDTNKNPEEEVPQVVTAVKSSMLGTPILKSSSPYSRLPKPDNFMEGVSPVIDFENLPNSTGKYEQMSEVLTKVRETMKSLESCKS